MQTNIIFLDLRIHKPCIDVAEFFEGKQVSGVFGVAKLVCASAIDRDGAGHGGGVGFLPGV